MAVLRAFRQIIFEHNKVTPSIKAAKTPQNDNLRLHFAVFCQPI
jgi:hypothetical protein